jgi:hypothetical protein
MTNLAILGGCAVLFCFLYLVLAICRHGKD